MDAAAGERLRRLGGDRLLARMLDLFLQNAPQRLATAREGRSRDDLEAVERAAHSLKSSAANIGAQRVRSAAERLERLAADGERDALEAGVRELEQALAAAEPELRAARASLRP